MKTIFIGYKHGGYKLYNPMTKKVIMSRDVTFAEDEEWQWNAAAEMDSKKQYIYILNDDVEDGVTLKAPAVQPEVVIQHEVAVPIATMMEWPRRQQRQPVHFQDCKVNVDDEVDDNENLVHFAFLADSEPRETCKFHSTPQMAKDYEWRIDGDWEKKYHDSNWF